MSSTGTVSSVMSGAPQTGLQEDLRTTSNQAASMPGLDSSIKTIQGVITAVHDSLPRIKAHTDIGEAIANGSWITLDHSLSDIVERFGKLRKGLRVRVSYTGPDGGQASATIIGVENEQVGQGTQIENKIQKGLYAIFGPGIGLG
jgi:hypothetical protein